MVLSQREGLLPGPGLAWSLWFLFFLQLWLLYFLLSWSFFWALSWLQFCAWTRVGFLRGRLVSFFVAVLVVAFVAFLVAVLVFAFVQLGAWHQDWFLHGRFRFLLVTILVFFFCIWWKIDIARLSWHSNMLFRLYASMLLQFWTRCEAVMWRIQTAWQRDCRLASRRRSSCLATALRSVPVNDRVWRSIVLWLECVLQ